MHIAFDIETIPNPAMLAKIPEPEVKTGNLKDPDKIAAKIAEAKAALADKLALDPLTGRVLCAAFVAGDNESVHIIKEATDEQERELIQKIMTFLAYPETRLVTWNGIGFDLPFVFKRAMVLGVNPANFQCPPLSAWVQRYKADRHVDLMQVFGGWKDYIKLDFAAATVLGERKTEIDVTTFAELMQTADGLAQIADYCLKDARLTLKLFERASGCLFV
jgi:predicted PolB exonuclease-like 3'-5' exonuclease